MIPKGEVLDEGAKILKENKKIEDTSDIGANEIHDLKVNQRHYFGIEYVRSKQSSSIHNKEDYEENIK